jgi:hypothetical protein
MAAKIASVDLKRLASDSSIILVGIVKKLNEDVSGTDLAEIEIVSVIKGQTSDPVFKLTLHSQGQKATDPKLKEGDKVVAFLKAEIGGKGTLTFPGSIAVLPIGNFFVQ